MNILEWECFEEFANKERFNVTDPGPLHYPISEISFKRDDELNIIITTTANHDAKCDAANHPVGTVRFIDESLTLTSITGFPVTIKGLCPKHRTIATNSKSGEGILTEISSAHSFEAVIQDLNKGKYLIEWLENVDDSTFIWPDSIRTVVEEKATIVIGNSDKEITLNTSSSSESFNRNCVYINVGGFELYLCAISKGISPKKVKPGFLLYKSCPPEEIRKKIRNCLSFSIGRPLIYIGYTIFSEDWKMVSLKAISGYSMGGAAYNLPTMPPAPLGTRYQHEIDPNILSRLVNSIYSNYKRYNFGYIGWMYWHAVCAPSHIAAVHFGATIEALQKVYLKNNGEKIITTLMNNVEWEKFKDSALYVVSELDIDDMGKGIIKNKINSLNQLPQSVITKRFLASLNIAISDMELSAWQQRNSAAHGNEVEDNDYIRLIREIKVLKVIFHRILLRIINGSDYYFDYYSIESPIRKITESIPNDARETEQ